MATYLSNTLLKFDNLEAETFDIGGLTITETYSVKDYTSLNFKEINDFINAMDQTMFDYYQLQNNTNLEKLALDIYGNPDYWDIILIINHKNPLFEMPYDFDTIDLFIETKIASYETDINKNPLSTIAYNNMYKKYSEDRIELNELWRLIKIVKPARLQEFLQRGYEEGVFN